MIAKAVKPKVELSLKDPGMTILHRAGVAGLYMTLKALEKRYPTLKTRQGNLQWFLTANSISLNWKGNDLAALDWLFRESFQISSDGLISLAGLQNQTLENQLITHIGISNTFLQHTSVLKFEGKASQSFTIDGSEVVANYKKTRYYIYQDYAKKLCNAKGQLITKQIGIKGWMYPGAAVKHEAFARTQFTETTERALGLLFAPVACFYFIAPKSYLHETKAQYCLVIPDIADLKIYSQQRQKLNKQSYQQFFASGYSDAAFRFVTQQATLKLAQQNKFKRCQVITLGQTQWSNAQKFRNRVDERKEGKIIASNIVRELITENLAREFPWWHNFALAVRNKDLFKLIRDEKKGLQQMVRNAYWDE